VHIFTLDLPDKKRCCRLINRKFRLLFRHWNSSVAVSALCFQLAAGELNNSELLQALEDQITCNLTSLKTEATAAFQQLQVAANSTIKNITLQLQASKNYSEQIFNTLNIGYQQVQACLIQKVQGLDEIANASGKQIIIIYRYTE